MNESSEQSQAYKTFNPIMAIPPTEEGGVEQRKGASYQDHVAAGYCIDMLFMSEFDQVMCESLDDIVLVNTSKDKCCVEFIQVKAGSSFGSWTKSTLCKRVKKSNNKLNVKPSIVERSLAHDCCDVVCTFRLIVCAMISDELKALTYNFNAPGRSDNASEIKVLKKYMKDKLGTYKSPNGNDVEFWVNKCIVEQKGEEEILEIVNHKKINDYALTLGRSLHSQQLNVIYEKILRRVTTASKAKWKEGPDKKVFNKLSFQQFIQNEIMNFGVPYSADLSKTLRDKMVLAGIDKADIDSAIELRHKYCGERFNPKYLQICDIELIDSQVLSTLQKLRAAQTVGTISSNGPSFHALCVDTISKLKTKNRNMDLSFITIGCMYEITSRCRHTFQKGKI